MLKNAVKVVYSAFPGDEFTAPMMHRIIVDDGHSCKVKAVSAAMMGLFKSGYLSRKEGAGNNGVLYFRR